MTLKDVDELIELIDDDIASLNFIDMSREGYDACLCTLKMVKQYIKALPTVEAAPIKNGQWIKSEKSDFAWECSNCGYGFSDYRTTYCYDCGARMTGGEDE